jgi:hypothetical protein
MCHRNRFGNGAASLTVLISQQGTVGVLDDEWQKSGFIPNPFSEGFM